MDVIVIGSGIASLKALHVANELGKKVIAIDSTYVDGGYVQVIDKEVLLPKAPFFVHEEDVDFFYSLGIEFKCLDVEVFILKNGNYITKTLGYSNIDVQKNWFYEWINRRKLCLHRNLFSALKKSLGYTETLPIHITSSIRRIDLANRIVALTSGEIIKYEKLVYTWPLPLLPKLLVPETIKNNVAQMLNNLDLQYVSSYILTVVLPKNKQNKIKIHIHSTKASRMHTAISISTGEHRVLYAITSYTKNYSLLPGIYEKLISELRRFKILSLKDIIKGYGLNITYALINKVKSKHIEELKQKLEEYNVYLYGRLGLWREQIIKEIIQDKKLEKTLS
ncbi:MAG: hypothetical protein QXL96_08810 [Ignisphaera sp.]